MHQYTLYKNPIQLDTLAIVQYLHSLGVRADPSRCIERCHPAWVTQLPTILDHVTFEMFEGLRECERFYERISGRGPGLLLEALAFKAAHPEYRIH
jgi:hypothetical protein